MKNYYFFILGVFLLASAPFSSAAFNLGNPPYNIKDTYSPGEVLSGWINLSLSYEPVNSLLKITTDSIQLITIKKFLENNLVDFDCFPLDCEHTYNSATPSISKNFNIGVRQSKIIGLKLDGEINEVK